jgi:hypothetical protein
MDPRARISAPYHVAMALQRLGVRPLRSPWLRGRYWVAPAAEADGTRVHVIIEAGTGRIINVSEADATVQPRQPTARAPAVVGPRVVLRDGTLARPMPRDQFRSALRPPARVTSRPVPERVHAAPKPRAVPLPEPRPRIAKIEPGPVAPVAAGERQSTPPVAPLDPHRSTRTTEAFPPAQGFE